MDPKGLQRERCTPAVGLDPWVVSLEDCVSLCFYLLNRRAIAGKWLLRLPLSVQNPLVSISLNNAFWLPVPPNPADCLTKQMRFASDPGTLRPSPFARYGVWRPVTLFGALPGGNN